VVESNKIEDARTINLETRVFPLLNLVLGQNGEPSAARYLGTCFLLNLNGQDVFVTAKHLLDLTPDSYNLYLSYCQFDGEATYLKVRCAYVNHTRKDLSFFIPTPEMQKDYRGVLSPMNLLHHQLPIGQGVLVYGFPESHQSQEVSGPPLVQIHRHRFEGKVVEIEDDYPLTNIGRVYKLNVAAPEGLSGAPLMVIFKEQVVVAGYVVGEQLSNGEPTAICSDISPLIEIEKLLLDITGRLGRSGKRV
jgi:hypothetical protein